MKRFLRMYWIEQKLFLRSPDALFFGVLMPVIVFFIIALVGGSKTAGDSGLTYLQSSYCALTTVGVCCGAFMGIPIVIVEYRHQGILRRLYCSPCSPQRILLCDFLSSAVVSIMSFILMSIVGLCMGYRMSGNVFAFIGVWLITLISMYSIGLLIASLCRTTRQMNIATTIVYFPMLLFSGATIPMELFPNGVSSILEYLPLGIGISVLKETSMGMYDNLWKLFILLGITLVSSAISIKTFKWE